MVQPWSNPSSPALADDREAVTLVDGSSFSISLPSGDMLTGFPHGLFYRDTRFLSTIRMRVNGEWPEPLSARATYPFSASMVLRAPPPPGIADSKLAVFRTRFVGQGMRDDVVVRNYGTEPAFCTVEFELDVDFADIFEVKAGKHDARRARDFDSTNGHLTWHYERGAFRRSTAIDFSRAANVRGSNVSFDVILPPGDDWTLCMQVTPTIDDVQVQPRHRCGEPVEWSEPVTRLESWRQARPAIRIEHAPMNEMIARSAEDLAALRITDPEFPERSVIAAGAPWFMTVFGRDSLLTSWMALLVDPALALGTLETLARFQGSQVDERTEEQPGRILHEMRFGEAAELSLGGGTVYYGSVDATPLFVMLLGELHRWGCRPEAVRALLPAADRALAWITEFGDRDGDGYVEYQQLNEQGLANQGWKDSFDSIRFIDGRLADPPIALAEVQGYVYAAFLARAAMADDDGDAARAHDLRSRAVDLKERFNRDFWMADRGWFALGLDARKQPIDALTSNIGHCLWTGIVEDEKIQLVTEKLMSSEMFNGWGLRTLASSMVGYNPLSYHNGSVWPHDSAIGAAGLSRAGHHDAAHSVLAGLVDAAVSFSDRMPELFAGIGRDELPFPVRYPTSCSPQAWSAASPLLLLRAVVGLDPDVPRGLIHVTPHCPPWLGTIRLEGVPLGSGRLSIEVHGDECRVLESPEGLTVVETPRRP
ncbi:MAG: glycogen debranching N-terminal domain-containing protein [Acidimicrobiia bacterium]